VEGRVRRVIWAKLLLQLIGVFPAALVAPTCPHPPRRHNCSTFARGVDCRWKLSTASLTAPRLCRPTRQRGKSLRVLCSTERTVAPLLLTTCDRSRFITTYRAGAHTHVHALARCHRQRNGGWSWLLLPSLAPKLRAWRVHTTNFCFATLAKTAVGAMSYCTYSYGNVIEVGGLVWPGAGQSVCIHESRAS
jgi:hypothetical protein